MLSKVREIITAWSIAANPSVEQKLVAEKRLQICNGMREDSKGERFVCEYLGEGMGEQFCKKCVCPLRGKIFTPKNLGGCPENKWTL